MAAFLADRGTWKPSAHTLKAYRQDFDAIATLLAGGGDLFRMPLSDITIDAMRAAFAQYAKTHEAASTAHLAPTYSGDGSHPEWPVPALVPSVGSPRGRFTKR